MNIPLDDIWSLDYRRHSDQFGGVGTARIYRTAAPVSRSEESPYDDYDDGTPDGGTLLVSTVWGDDCPGFDFPSDLPKEEIIREARAQIIKQGLNLTPDDIAARRKANDLQQNAFDKAAAEFAAMPAAESLVLVNVVNELLESVIAGQAGAIHRLRRCPGALLDRKYHGMSMEQIYDLLLDDGDRNGPAPLGEFVKPSEAPPNADGTPATGADALAQEWKAAAVQAATVSRTRNRGQLPGAIAELLTEMVEPAIPWQDLLRQFVSRIVRDDYSFRRPNRRFAHQGVILPTLRSEGIGTIVAAVDTSGSIRCNEALLKTFLSELQGILDTTSPEAIHLLDCDARIHSATRLTSGDDLRGTVFHGGGGTCFRPVFEWVEENDIQPACLLYFTDLEGGFPREEPPYPTLWLNYGDPRAQAPFGQTIHIPRA